MNTLDLLLVLGGQVADILKMLLSRKITKDEQEQVQALVQQYNQVKEAHLQIQSLVQQYNQGFVRGITIGDMGELFPFCTHEGYQQAEQLYDDLVQNQVVSQTLLKLDILSVSLITQTVEEVSFASVNVANYQQAKAYTYEIWATAYQNGTRVEHDTINCYQLVRIDNTWKMDDSEAYVKAT
ncbi:MAG: hypothetical protein JW850_14390 [Thermoflexales bacterium]|nr:hypothetical protein [Thermoflexales bacterium]